jgi:transposase InsO family protein
MKKNSLMQYGESIIRILDIQDTKVLVIDCIKKTMPIWMYQSEITGYTDCCQQELLRRNGDSLFNIEMLDAKSKQTTHARFTMIAGIFSVIGDITQRNEAIRNASVQYNVSQQTIRKFLCLYLVYQDMSVLAPKKRMMESELTQDEKNMRWALNKYFYSKKKNSLKTAYTLLLKEKYCDGVGVLLPEYPTFCQFRYFYRKTKSLQTYYISRDGLKNYQRNNRPLTGDGIQEFAPFIGVGMLDATICDIYLVNDSGSLVGRPILTACVDAYSGLCCGYSLTWEGGTYSLRSLMLNVITDKIEWCKTFGISIQKDEWDCDKLPGTLVTDMGSEYKSENFEQIAELGVTIINLPAYRPELKGSVEKLFDVIQDLFKPHLKGKGVVEPDYMERGAHDYRKDACLTMADFEKIILNCIIYYNSKRIVEGFPYTEKMLSSNIKPYASHIWNWGKLQIGANLISVEREQLILTLLPRTEGRFNRFGLKVNGLRYKHNNYNEKYLCGGVAIVAYNPDDVSFVWLIENGKYIRFELIESRFSGKELAEVETLRQSQKKAIKAVAENNIQAQIDLAQHIEIIARNAIRHEDVCIKDIRNSRKKEQTKTHIDYMRGGEVNG